MDFDRNKSLQELENSDWGNPKSDFPLEEECLHLRRIPVKDFESPDLCCMIGQKIGEKYLIPMAIERLHLDPLADRNWYPGSLLEAVLRASAEYWEQNVNQREEVEQIFQKALLNEEIDEHTITLLKKAYLFFHEFEAFISLLWKQDLVQVTCNCFAVEVLAIIASRQPITMKEIEELIETDPSPIIPLLLKEQFIMDSEFGFRLTKNFSKQISSISPKTSRRRVTRYPSPP